MSKDERDPISPPGINKPTGQFHPADVKDFVPAHVFIPTDLGDETQYDGLTEHSPYCEYAWAFLRRNRFFQSQQDAKENGVPVRFNEDFWAFQTGFDRPRETGLSNNPRYWQPYNQNIVGRHGKKYSCVQWIICTAILNQLEHLDGTVQYFRSGPKAQQASLEYPESQIQITFDLTTVWSKKSTLDIQMKIAQEQLTRIAAEFNKHEQTPKAQKRTDKKLLMRYLRIADLLSAPAKTPIWPGIGEHVNKASSAANQDTAIQYAKSRLAAWSKRIETSSSLNIDVSADALIAFDYVYLGRYLELLTFDSTEGSDQKPKKTTFTAPQEK